MSEAQKLMESTLLLHEWDKAAWACICGAQISRFALRAHQAAEMDKALGGLTRQIAGPDGCAYGYARWVSSWTEAPHD